MTTEDKQGNVGFRPWRDLDMLAVAIVCLSIAALAHLYLDLNHRVTRINHAYTACEGNRAYTPELQGQCVEDYLGMNR